MKLKYYILQKTIITIIVLICTSSLLIADYSGSLTTNQSELTFEQKDEYDLISLKNGYFTEEIGAPKLPVKIKKYLIPLDMKPINISVTNTAKNELENQYYIYPAQPPRILDGSDPPPFVEPIDSIYNSYTPYPEKLIEIIGDECTMGYHVVTLRICPIEYIPKQKKINLYTDIDFTIEYESITTPIRQARRQSLSRYNSAKKSIKNMVENPDDFESVTGGAVEIVNEQTEMNELDLRVIPSFEGDIPEYIIITNNDLKPVFEELAEWKTKKGFPALIVTIQQIDDNYSGCDMAEKIRHYLQDARYYWGDNLYILLGGDTGIVPHRLISYSGYGTIPSDLYYSDVYYSGDPIYNWNANGNNIFGETGYNGDNIHYGPDIILGRASVEDETEAQTFINKVISYEKLDNQNYDISDVNNVLLMAVMCSENYFQDILEQYYIYANNLPTVNVPNGWIHGWKMFDDYDGTHVPPWHHTYPGHEETTRDHFIAALNNGSAFTQGNFHIVYHADHAGPYVLGTSLKMKHEVVNRADMDGLENIPYQILMTCGCYPNRFNLDCICEHYINNPDHGGVAIVGNSCVGYCDSDPQFKNFVVNLYGTENNGWECQEYNMGSLFQTMTGPNDTRKSLNLLGDPEMPVWSNTPEELIVDITPSEITNGENTITVTINDLAANDTARVCLQKDNEAYAYKEVDCIENTAIFIFTPDTPGEMDVTVTAHNYFPYETKIDVDMTGGSHLYVTDKTFDDDNVLPSYGNGDGQVDAGEIIELSITLTNSGSADALDVSAELICDPEFINITQNQSNFGDINAGESAVSQINYIFEVDPDTPDGEYVCDTLFIYEGTVLLHTDVFYLQIGAPELDKIKNIITTSDGDDIIEADETVYLKIELFNQGDAEATGVTAELTTSYSSVITITQDSVSYGNIASLTSTGEDIDPFVFDISEDYDGETFNLEITNEYGRVWEFNNFNLNKPESVESIEFSSMQDEIDLWWDPVPDGEDDEYFIRGYNIYRLNQEDEYEKLNNFIVEGTSYYKDTEVEPATNYCYKISAITESGNESDLTEPYEAWTTLPFLAGWPVSSDVGSSIHGSTNIYDIDADGYKEIFNTIVQGGYIMGFNSDGTEPFDIDGDPSTISGFAQLDNAVWATPALGDIDSDGIVEVVVATRDNNEGKLYAYKTVDNDGDGKPDLVSGFPIALTAYFENVEVWRGPVLSDINCNGYLEIILTDQRGRVYVFDHTGESLPGWPINVNSSGSSYGMPAVADLDGNGYKEIIMGYKNGLYVWNYDGSDYMSNPFYQNTCQGYNVWFVCPPVVVDLDNNGDYEVLVISTLYVANGTPSEYRHGGHYYGYVLALHHDGSLVDGWGLNDVYSHPVRLCSDKESPHQPPAIVVGDLNGDMDIEVIVGGNPYLYIWDHQGNPLQEINISGLKVYSIAPVLADIDDDNDIEIVIASNNGKIYAYNYDGTMVPYLPLKTDDAFWTSPCIGDIDNDGKSELIAGNYSGKTYVWDTEGDPNKIEWSCYRNNSHNTGVYNGSVTVSGTLTHDETWMENVFITGDVIVPSGITLTIDNSCRVYLTGNGSLIVENGGILNLKKWSRIQGICSENRIEVYGDILISNNVSFTAPDNHSWDGLHLLNADAEVTMNNVTFERCKLYNESYTLILNNSEFIYSRIDQYGNKVYISETNFNSSMVYCYYRQSKIPLPDDVEINISDCYFSNYIDYPVYISGYDLYNLNSNIISGCNGGFYIFESGHPVMCTISNNIIENNTYGNGIVLYHSYADILGHNRIKENSVGFVGVQNSSITIIGNDDYPLQTIKDNRFEEMVFDLTSFPKKREMYYNKIMDDNIEGSSDQYLIRCANYTGDPRDLIVEDNYWGPASLDWTEWTGDDRFDPSDAFDYIPVWDPGIPRSPGSSTPEQLFAEADSLIIEEDYEQAKLVYKDIIELYPESDFTIYSMRNLLPLETVSGQDFASLQEYYQTDPNCNYNPERTKLSEYLANWCNIKLENYPDAITFFEDIIEDPDTELDSVYAVIDAGYTYLLMGDGGGKSTYIGRMPELKPKSVLEFEKTRDRLLAKALGLPEQYEEEIIPENVFYLGQNYPNPMRSSTTISFSLPDGIEKAGIRIYNIKGQLVKTFPTPNSKSQIATIIWDGRDEKGKQLTNGIYLYKLSAGSKSITKKMLLMR